MDAPPASRRGETLAILALIFGALFFIPGFSIVAVTLSVIALVRIPQDRPRGLAVAALLVGLVGTIVTVVLATTGILAFKYRSRHMNKTQAAINLRRLVSGAVALQAGKTPVTLTPTDWTPAQGACAFPYHAIPKAPAVWQVSPWKELHFDHTLGNTLQYRVTQAGDDIVPRAAYQDIVEFMRGIGVGEIEQRERARDRWGARITSISASTARSGPSRSTWCRG